MLDNAFKGFPSQVQALETRIAALQLRDDPEGLNVMIEPTKCLHLDLQLIFARMPERRMAEVVGQGDGLGEIGV